MAQRLARSAASNPEALALETLEGENHVPASGFHLLRFGSHGV